MSNKVKVLTIVNSLEMGGIEKTLLSCVRVINENNMAIEIYVCCFKKGGVLERNFQDLGVKLIYISKTGSILLDGIQLIFVLLKYNIDVVHSRFGFTSGGFVLAAKLLGRKVVVSLHNTVPSTFNALKKNFLYRMFSFHLKVHRFITKHFADNIVGHSQANLNANYRGWESKSKYKLIYNGINLGDLSKPPRYAPELSRFIEGSTAVILHIGSFRSQKNHLFLIDCFRELIFEKPDAKLILVGKGELEPVIKEKVSDYGLSENVFFAGQTQEIQSFFEVADLFFFPSKNEGLGNAVLEAQYKRVPVCCSKLAPLAESTYKGYHQYFFDPEHQDEAVAQLKKIIEDSGTGRLNRTFDEAKNFVEANFSLENMVRNLVDLYLCKK